MTLAHGHVKMLQQVNPTERTEVRLFIQLRLGFDYLSEQRS